jgi:pyruvate dehydrogenase E1 component alpha subunit/2-oxoisovalerate dehydrogenase E1 component alpha subunit
MIRNAAACAELGMSVTDMFRAYLATADSPSAGHDLHVGDFTRGVLQPISHVGDMVPVVTGIAMSFTLRAEPRVALTWVGDGATKTAAVHEGLNLAAVQRAPAVFVLQNNQVALGTGLAQHHLPPDFGDWAASYGIAGSVFDGNNVLDGFAATAVAVERCRAGRGPALLVADTFRMGGHATHDEHEARATLPPALFAEWGRRDPIGLYEEHLREDGVPVRRLEEIEASVSADVTRAAAEALASRERSGPGAFTLRAVYATAPSTERPPRAGRRMEDHS